MDSIRRAYDALGLSSQKLYTNDEIQGAFELRALEGEDLDGLQAAADRVETHQKSQTKESAPKVRWADVE